MKYIGLTGGIGSGKSTIARILQCMGYPVYISDQEASRLMNTLPVIRKELETQFGQHIYMQDGKINKPVVAQIIFNNRQALQTINQIVHPRVMEDFKYWGANQQHECIFFESAILFEAHLDHFFDQIICVTAPEEIRLIRVANRDKIPFEQIRERMQNQLDDTQKCKRSNFIIHNDPQHRIIAQILDILQTLQTSNHNL